MNDIIICGCGGAGRELAFGLESSNVWRVIGFVDDTKRPGEYINGIRVLGGIDSLQNGNVVICIVGNPKIKRQIVSRIKIISKKIKFPIVLNEDSRVSNLTYFGEGCLISLAFNWVSPNVALGDFVFINCTTRIGHDVVVGDYTTIYSGIDIGGGVQIGKDCVIGSGVVINPKVKIGNNVIVGGGSTVVKDIPDNVIAVGSPAKVIKRNDNG